MYRILDSRITRLWYRSRLYPLSAILPLHRALPEYQAPTNYILRLVTAVIPAARFTERNLSRLDPDYKLCAIAPMIILCDLYMDAKIQLIGCIHMIVFFSMGYDTITACGNMQHQLSFLLTPHRLKRILFFSKNRLCTLVFIRFSGGYPRHQRSKNEYYAAGKTA